jgi:drug/metabolite transporter (DMT)-like permease
MSRLAPVLVLVGCGAAWGLALPLMRVAVSTGYPALGLVFWNQAIMAIVLLPVLRLIGRPLPPKSRNLDLYAAIALFGAVLPGYFSFVTAAHLPAGVRGILIAMVPMFVLPMALVLGFERPDARRAAGVVLGAVAVVIISRPEAGIAPQAGLAMILLALVPPLSYGIEANLIAARPKHGLHPFQVLFGASVIGIALSLPLALATGQMIIPPARWGAPEWAFLATALVNLLAYAGYVWLVGQAGSLFASLVGYLVTGFGVVWSWLLLGETYSVWVWAAFVLILAGVTLVQPLGARAKAP